MFCHTEAKEELCGLLYNCFHNCPEGVLNRVVKSAVGSVTEWALGTFDLRPSHSLRRRSLFTEKREDPLAGPTWFSQSHIPRHAFPTMAQTHHSVLSWKKSNGVGDHMSKDLPSSNGRHDLLQMSQLGHSQEVRGNMERAWIWQTGLVSVMCYRNIWF